ncbi:MAG TPA: hypothetical protein VMY37_08160 [Thermoguttaceae bacterium]|nr:hypothetical protein [Thermoguttaceae bacterium]
MRESEQERELAAWEARLSAFRPGPSRLDRDRAMYLAGRASAERERSRPARPSVRWAWPAALASMTAVAGCLLVVLVVQHPGDTPPQVPGSSGSVAQERPRVPVQDRDEAPAARDHREVPAAEPQRVFWPGNAEPETWTVRSSRMDDSDRAFPRFADSRVFEPAWQSECPPGSFGPPVGPVPPRRPRSYVEHRRMLLEELKCFRETSAEGPFRQPTGV